MAFKRTFKPFASEITFDNRGRGISAPDVQSAIEQVYDKIVRTSPTLDVVSVKDFGAVGNGVVDDTAAIQNALDSLADGGVLYFPPGIYPLRKRSGTDVIIQAELRRGITLMGAGDTSIIDIQGETPLFGIRFYGCENIRVTGLHFKGVALGDPPQRRHFEIISFTNKGEVGSKNCVFDNNRLTVTTETNTPNNIALYGVYFGSHPPAGSAIKRYNAGFICSNNIFYNSIGRAVQTWLAENIVVSNNVFDEPINGPQVRLVGGPKNVSVTGNTIKATLTSYRVDAIYVSSGGGTETLNAENITISGNTIFFGGNSSTSSLAVMIQSAENVNIVGNSALYEGPSGASAIRIYSPIDPFITSKIMITNNLFSGWYLILRIEDDNATHIVHSNNMQYYLAPNYTNKPELVHSMNNYSVRTGEIE